MLVTLQHELAPARRRGGDATTAGRTGTSSSTTTRSSSPTDYDPYCITAPVDAASARRRRPADLRAVRSRNREGRAGGHAQNELVGTTAISSSAGTASTCRCRRGSRTASCSRAASAAASRSTDNCDVVGKIDNPGTYLCHRESAFLPQVKLLGTYPLPWWGLQVSGTFQSQISDPVGGAEFRLQLLRAAGQLRGRQRSESVRRSAATCRRAATVTVNVVEPGTLYPDRTNQLDAPPGQDVRDDGRAAAAGAPRRLQRVQLERRLRINGAYGSNGVGWGTPQAIVPGRLVKFGAQLRF